MSDSSSNGSRDGHSPGGVRYSFFIEPVALTVFPWIESADGERERGCRVEIQQLEIQREGSYAATPRYVLGASIWRGDFFTLEGALPGNTDRAHHHIAFDGQEPSDRVWDEALTRDPVAWFERELDDLGALLQRCGADVVVDGDAVRSVLPSIIQAVRSCMPAGVLAALQNGSQRPIV
jgi:hypothetical protein